MLFHTFSDCSSPVSPIPSVSAFIVVITVAAVKQAYEDIKRHRADDKVFERWFENYSGMKLILKMKS